MKLFLHKACGLPGFVGVWIHALRILLFWEGLITHLVSFASCSATFSLWWNCQWGNVHEPVPDLFICNVALLNFIHSNSQDSSKRGGMVEGMYFFQGFICDAPSWLNSHSRVFSGLLMLIQYLFTSLHVKKALSIPICVFAFLFWPVFQVCCWGLQWCMIPDIWKTLWSGCYCCHC